MIGRCIARATPSLMVLLAAMGLAASTLAAPAKRAKTNATPARATVPAPAKQTPAPAFDTLAGNLPAMLLSNDRPYLVTADVYVPQGKRVSIGPGVVLLFRNFTGLHVMGVLSAVGNKEHPVIFTSVNDKQYHPTSTLDAAPFDWNGIYLHEDAVGSELSNCSVLYSVEGINASTRFFRLDPCVLLHNGNANLTIEGVARKVGSEPCTYSLAVNDPSLKGVPAQILRDPLAPKRAVFRYMGLGLAAGGGVMAIVFAARLSGSSHTFSQLSSTGDANLFDHTSSDWEKARKERNANTAATLIGLTLTAVGAVGLAWSFTF